MRNAITTIILVACVTGCSSPEDSARRILASRYPIGSSSDGLAETFKARRYRPVECPSDPDLAKKMVGCGPNVGANSIFGDNAKLVRPPGPPTCMVRPQYFFMASGFIVCWIEAADKRIEWHHADWIGGKLPPLAE